MDIGLCSRNIPGKYILIWKKQEKNIPIIAHVCGTPLDPQDYNESLTRLASHGIITMPTNAQAAKLATLITLRKEIRDIV